MGMVEEVVAYLATQSCGTAGTTLFAHTLPESTGMCSAVIELPASAPSRTFKQSLPWAENARVQVLCRSTLPSSGATIAVPTNARARAQKIWRTLEAVSNSTSIASGKRYYRIEAQQSPFKLQDDERGRSVFSCTFDVMRAPTTSD